ncbi:MAG: ABC transporter substrate-binding protein [Clostridiales Family XIII bacterium]|jgi:NitT/TauT family transport system substrate-binding protein|nr:ABC transporter substrate-binding protein [Clostridiales Family XIII bacterium]
MKGKHTTLRLAAVLLALATLTLLAGACSSGGSANQAENEAPAESAEAAESAESTETAWTSNLGRELNIGIVGAACELHFYAAEKLGLYEKAGYKVNWVHVGNEQTAMIETGTVDVTDGVLDHWLKPIENGLNIKATIGLHQGCMGVVVNGDSPYQTIEDLKGQTIGALNASGVGNYFWRLLLLEGYRPQDDFKWIQLTGEAAIAALENGEIAAISGGDTGFWPKVQSGDLRFISRQSTDPQLADQTCCVLVFNTKFSEDYPEDTKKLTEILYEASVYLQEKENIAEIVDYGYEKGLILSGDPATAYEVAESYTWDPGYQIGHDSFESIFKAYQEFDIITKDADPQKVIDRLFIKYDEF